MPTTTRALFSELIDYAGIFPPAALPLDEAFRRFLTHRQGEAGWVIARFVCPAARLDELAVLVENTETAQTPIRVASLGSGGDDPPTFAGALESDLEFLRRFADRMGERARVEVYEVRLPSEGDPAEVTDLVIHNLGDTAERPPMPYFEIPLLGDHPNPTATAAAVASAAHEIDPSRRAGLKIRCGGLDAAAVPTVDAVASAISATVTTGLALKATQGLHHPLRGEDRVLGATVHGFFNLLTAAILAYEHFLDPATIRDIVAEEDPETFRIDDAGVHWRHLDAGVSSVVESRMAAFSGFGSCSFSEPRDDLADLGWL